MSDSQFRQQLSWNHQLFQRFCIFFAQILFNNSNEKNMHYFYEKMSTSTITLTLQYCMFDYNRERKCFVFPTKLNKLLTMTHCLTTIILLKYTSEIFLPSFPFHIQRNTIYKYIFDSHRLSLDHQSNKVFLMKICVE